MLCGELLKVEITAISGGFAFGKKTDGFVRLFKNAPNVYQDNEHVCKAYFTQLLEYYV